MDVYDIADCKFQICVGSDLQCYIRNYERRGGFIVIGANFDVRF